MHPISKKLISTIPDWSNWKKAEAWLTQGRKTAKSLDPKKPFYAMSWDSLQTKAFSPFGFYSETNWRKFVLGIYLADLISYSIPADQVRFDHLAFTLQKFPQGFTLWWSHGPQGWWPAGYTAWIPIQEAQFKIFLNSPQSLTERLVIPQETVKGRPWLYLYNYSVAPNLKGSALTQALIKGYSKTILALRPKGFATVTVSNDGRRVAQKFGMKRTGSFKIQNTLDVVYCTPGRL